MQISHVLECGAARMTDWWWIIVETRTEDKLERAKYVYNIISNIKQYNIIVTK